MINPNRMVRRDLNTMRKCCNNTSASNDARKLMHELQLIDFSLIDTILYLDAYPCSEEALDYYHKLLAEKNKVKELLEQIGYPIIAQGNTSTTEWKWTDGPWSWELEANL